MPVYNGLLIVICPSVCALVAIFPCTHKRINYSSFSKGKINFTIMQTRRHGKTQKKFIQNLQALCATISEGCSAQSL